MVEMVEKKNIVAHKGKPVTQPVNDMAERERRDSLLGGMNLFKDVQSEPEIDSAKEEHKIDLNSSVDNAYEL